MKKIKNIVGVICLSIAFALIVPLISQDSLLGTTTEAAVVKLNKTKVTLNVGKSTQLSVKGTKKKVTWESLNKKVATVSSKGKVTAKKKGTAKIIAKVTGKKYICKVTVKEIPLKAISLNKTSLKLDIDDTYNLKVKYLPTNTTVKKNVTWSSSNKNVANINKNGVIYAYNPGATIITAKVGNKKATCKVTVNDYYVYDITSSDIEFMVSSVDSTKVSVIVNNKTNQSIIIDGSATLLSGVCSYIDTLHASEQSLDCGSDGWVTDFEIPANSQLQLNFTDGYSDYDIPFDFSGNSCLMFDILYNNMHYCIIAESDGRIFYNNYKMTFNEYLNYIVAYGVDCLKEHLKNPSSFTITRMGYKNSLSTNEIKVLIEYSATNSYGAPITSYAYISTDNTPINLLSNDFYVWTPNLGCINTRVSSTKGSFSGYTIVKDYSKILDLADYLYSNQLYLIVC